MKTTALPLSPCVLALVVAFSFVAQGTPGDLDPSFNGTGKVVTAIGDNIEGGSIVLQSDGKIIVAGSSLSDQYYVAMVRYLPDGSLDVGFGENGIVETALGASGNYGYHAALQHDGKIIVAGSTHTDYGDEFAVVRYNTDGSLDTTFGDSGKTTTFGAIGGIATSVVVGDDGRIFAAGTSPSGFQVICLTANGQFDGTFYNTGSVITRFGGNLSDASSVALQSDGKIVVVGHTYNGSNYDIAVVRYRPNGQLDTSFNGTGKVITAIGNNDYGYSVAIQDDGRIVVAGYSSNGFALLRYNGDGSLDPAFNGTGKVTTDIGSGLDSAYAVCLQGDGKIVTAGKANNGGADFIAVVRYKPDGSLDQTFGGTGIVTTTLGSSQNFAFGVTLKSDGKIVVGGAVGGSAYNGNVHGFAVLRYLGDAVLPPLSAWKLAHLGDANASDTDDADGDGAVTLLEYASGRNPTASDAVLAPAVTAFDYPDGRRLRMIFARDTAHSDVTIDVQAASGLAGPWTTIASSILGAVTSGPGYVGGDNAGFGIKQVEVRDIVDTNAASQRFLRLRVTH